MIMDGTMKNNSKNIINTILLSFVILAVIKIIYVLIESFILPHAGVNHIADSRIKPLYYRVKLDKQETLSRTPKKVKKKPLASIKDIKLIAIYASSDNVVVTVIYKGKTKVLVKNDTINGFRLIAGTSHYALFEKNNKTYKVDLLEHQKNGKSSIDVVGNTNNDIDTNQENSPMEDENNKVIQKDVFNHFVNNMDEIYKNIGIREIKKGDKKLFKVAFIRRGSPFAKLGIKRGDIIKSINGQDIDSYNAAFMAYRSIKDADSLNVVVIRNNKELELEYEIK